MSDPTPTLRERIVEALFTLVSTDAFFPSPATDPEAMTLDDPEATGWRMLDGGLQDCADVSDMQGDVDVVAEALGGDGDASDIVCDLNLKPTLAYACAGADKSARRARRDTAAQHFTDLIAADRTLGVDPQVYAVIEAAERRDDVPQDGAQVAATLIVTLSIDYVASSPAG